MEDGFAKIELTVNVKNDALVSHWAATFRRLRFSGFEAGHKLFGISAESVLNLIQSQGGTLQLDDVVEADLNEFLESPAEPLRNSIARALKDYVGVSVQNLVEETIDEAMDRELQSVALEEEFKEEESFQKVLEF